MQQSNLLLMHQPQRNDKVLKDETKYHWACSFLRQLSFFSPRCEGNLETTLRLSKFGKPASRTHDKKLPVDASCSVQGIYLSSLKLHSADEGGSTGWAVWQKDSACPQRTGFPETVTPQPLWNSQTPITACVLEALNQCETFLLHPSCWSRESKHIDYHYLQGNTMIYGAKLAIIWSLLKSLALPCGFPYNCS